MLRRLRWLPGPQGPSHPAITRQPGPRVTRRPGRPALRGSKRGVGGSRPVTMTAPQDSLRFVVAAQIVPPSLSRPLPVLAAAAMAATLGVPALGPGDFARQMIETSELVTFL